MNLLLQIVNLMKQIPIWVWIIALVCVLVPTLWYAVKRSAKILFVVAGIAVILFIFPSITTSFMNRAGLTYDETTGTLTNRDGQSIQLMLPSNNDSAVTQQDVNSILKQMEDAGITIEDLLKSGGATEKLGEYIKDLQENAAESTDTQSLQDLIDGSDIQQQ